MLNLSQTRCSTKALAKRRCKLKTWVFWRLRLARPCAHFRRLAITCLHFGPDQIYMLAKASFSPFGRPTLVNASLVTSINLLLANEIEDMSALKCFLFCDLRVLARNFASPFGDPTQFSTKVQLASTCDYLPVRSARGLKYGDVVITPQLTLCAVVLNSYVSLPTCPVSGHCLLTTDSYILQSCRGKHYSCLFSPFV